MTEEEFDDLTGQDLYECTFALILINELIEHGLIEGPFTVAVDNCFATISLLEATDDVERPTKERSVEVAMGLLHEAGDSPEDEVQPMTLLLYAATPELEFADE